MEENKEIQQRRKRCLSLIQPTSVPTLGNYLGALKGWPEFQDKFDTIYGVADLHSITVRQDPQKLRKQATEMFAVLLALGLDPEKAFCLFSLRCRLTASSAGFLIATLSSVSFRE